MTHPNPKFSIYEDGSLSTVGDRSVIRFERHLNQPVERVWRDRPSDRGSGGGPCIALPFGRRSISV